MIMSFVISVGGDERKKNGYRKAGNMSVRGCGSGKAEPEAESVKKKAFGIRDLLTVDDMVCPSSSSFFFFFFSSSFSFSFSSSLLV
jgi:hypothetical protein